MALTDSAGHMFSTEDWAGCLAEQDELERNPQEVIKREGSSSVIVKTLKVGLRKIKAVVKIRMDKDYSLGLWHSLRGRRSLRNFEKAILLKRAGVPAEIPLAALWHRKNAFTEKSIYLTEYVPQSVHIYSFAVKDLAAMANQFAIKTQLAQQLARILADLHGSGLWHRDAKPSNLLVHKDQDGQYNLTLVDLDGVKSYCGLRTFNRRFRPFAHLAALWLASPVIYRTDCLRTFNIYCNLTGVDKAARKRLVRRLVEGPVAKRLAAVAMKSARQTAIAG